MPHRRHHLRFLGLDPPAGGEVRAQISPVPYEGTVSWGRGTAEGPRALLEASAQVELWDELLEGEPYCFGIETEPIPPSPESPEEAFRLAGDRTRAILELGRLPVVIGGEHSLSYGVYRALAEHHGPIGVVQLDAHADLRDTYESQRYSHACVMARIREHTDQVVQLGIRSLSRREADRIRRESLTVGFMHRLRDGSFDLEAALSSLPPRIHLTLDVDALDPSLVRATGTPEPGGFTWEEINRLVARILRRKRVVGLDVTELCGGDAVSAHAVARLLYRMIGWILAEE